MCVCIRVIFCSLLVGECKTDSKEVLRYIECMQIEVNGECVTACLSVLVGEGMTESRERVRVIKDVRIFRNFPRIENKEVASCFMAVQLWAHSFESGARAYCRMQNCRNSMQRV